MKRLICSLICLFVLACGSPVLALDDATQSIDYSSFAGTELRVYNWGEYIADGSEGSYDLNAAFEELTGIHVVYETFDSNESMYTILKAGGTAYDVIIPSDYMIGKLIAEDMLEKLDFSNIPNYSNIPDEYRNLDYDPGNEYSVPYTFGRVGVIYNTTMVDEKDAAEQSWDLIYNPKYKGKILQFNNPRDAFATAQFALGQSVNTTDKADWDEALAKLQEQKPLLQGFVMDEIFNKMESGEAAIATYYLGDFFTMYTENHDLAFYHPKEGTNFFVDAMCVPKGAQHKQAAELYINFMLDSEVALENAEYICYGCPNSAVIENEDYLEFLQEELHPDAFELLYGQIAASVKTEIFENLDPDTNTYMNRCWEELKSGDNGNMMIYWIGIGLIVLLVILVIVLLVRRHRRRIIDDDEE